MRAQDDGTGGAFAASAASADDDDDVDVDVECPTRRTFVLSEEKQRDKQMGRTDREKERRGGTTRQG